MNRVNYNIYYVLSNKDSEMSKYHSSTIMGTNNYLLTLFRVLQGRTGNFREIHFLKGFRDFFDFISSSSDSEG